MTVVNETFRIRMRHAHIRNSFSRLLYLRISPASTGSYIAVRSGMHPTVLAFTIFWFTVLALWIGLVLLAVIAEKFGRQRILEGNHWSDLLWAFGMGVFGFLLVRSGREDAVELERFVESTLQARRIHVEGAV
jgi:hypothetical protein